MKSGNPFHAAGLAAVLLALGACGDDPAPAPSAPPEDSPHVVDLGAPVEDAASNPHGAVSGAHGVRGKSGLTAEPFGNLPDEYRFVERSGKEMTLGDLRGRFVLVDFVFTSCAGPCPPMMASMQGFQNLIRDRDDIVLLSVTVDPLRDTTDVLADYAKSYGADADGWLFARMPIEFVNDLTRDKLVLGDGGNPLAHSTKFVLIDPQGRARGLYEPLRDGSWMDKVLADVERLKGEPQ